MRCMVASRLRLRYSTVQYRILHGLERLLYLSLYQAVRVNADSGQTRNKVETCRTGVGGGGR